MLMKNGLTTFCKHSKPLQLIRSHTDNPMPNGLPPLEEYIECVQKRRAALQTIHQRGGDHNRMRQSRYPPSVVV
jgi:hypothetical protein